MADTKISNLTELAGASLAAGDWLVAVDASATQTKKVDPAEYLDAPLVTDSGSLITATTVNGALQEIFNGSNAVNIIAASGSTRTLSLAPSHRLTLSANCVVSFTTPTAASHTFFVYVTGAFTITWPASVDWPSATAPTYATGALFVFTTLDTGTTYLGNMIGSGFA